MFPPTLADMLYAANKAEMRQRAADAGRRQRALDAEQADPAAPEHEARHRRARTHRWPHRLAPTFRRTAVTPDGRARGRSTPASAR
jgi:hypothetical protein